MYLIREKETNYLIHKIRIKLHYISKTCLSPMLTAESSRQLIKITRLLPTIIQYKHAQWGKRVKPHFVYYKYGLIMKVRVIRIPG